VSDAAWLLAEVFVVPVYAGAAVVGAGLAGAGLAGACAAVEVSGRDPIDGLSVPEAPGRIAREVSGRGRAAGLMIFRPVAVVELICAGSPQVSWDWPPPAAPA